MTISVAFLVWMVVCFYLNKFNKTYFHLAIQAASLVSVNAGCDTVMRVIAGFVLDLKPFRERRPEIFTFITFFQGTVMLLYPTATTFTSFVVLSVFEGMFTGVKQAQVHLSILHFIV